VAAVIHHGIDPDAYPAGLGAGDDQAPHFVFLGLAAISRRPPMWRTAGGVVAAAVGG
jgi:hypothetical protein